MDNANETRSILDTMLSKDNFSEWLGLEIDEYRVGYCKLHFKVKEEMLNGFSIVHGGVLFAAADSAFAFACNSNGVLSVALDVHISFIKSSTLGETITVEAKEISTGNKVSFYDLQLFNEKGEIIATFKGTAFRTGRRVVDDHN